MLREMYVSVCVHALADQSHCQVKVGLREQRVSHGQPSVSPSKDPQRTATKSNHLLMARGAFQQQPGAVGTSL